MYVCVCMYISNLLAVLCFHCFTGFSPVVVSGHCFLVAVHRLLIAEISLVLKHKLKGARASIVVAHVLSSCSSQALENRLNSCGTQA